MERVHSVTDLERLNSLKGFEVALESFLNRYADAQAPQLTALEGIERLDHILKESRLGAKSRVMIEEWMKKYGDLASTSELPTDLRRRISHMLLDVQSRLTTETAEELAGTDAPDDFALNDARERFLSWRERSGSSEEMTDPELSSNEQEAAELATSLSRSRGVSVVTPDAGGETIEQPVQENRKVTLRRPAESKDENLTGGFFELLWSEMEYLEHVVDNGEHTLTVLDEMLACAEAKTDPMYRHLAASFIYYLKERGYKMAPYVKRLRDIPVQTADSV
jgi:hypothetical protein